MPFKWYCSGEDPVQERNTRSEQNPDSLRVRGRPCKTKKKKKKKKLRPTDPNFFWHVTANKHIFYLALPVSHGEVVDGTVISEGSNTLSSSPRLPPD